MNDLLVGIDMLDLQDLSSSNKKLLNMVSLLNQKELQTPVAKKANRFNFEQ